MIISVVTVDEFNSNAIDLLGHAGDALVEREGFVGPISVALHAMAGKLIARFTEPAGIEWSVDIARAWTLSQDGASLQLVDANGRQAEILLMIRSKLM